MGSVLSMLKNLCFLEFSPHRPPRRPGGSASGDSDLGRGGRGRRWPHPSPVRPPHLLLAAGGVGEAVTDSTTGVVGEARAVHAAPHTTPPPRSCMQNISLSSNLLAKITSDQNKKIMHAKRSIKTGT